MEKPTFKISVGNSKRNGASGISQSAEGSPLIGGMEAGNGSNILFDKDGNLFQEATKNLFVKGKTLFEELEKKNVVILDQYTLKALNVALSAIESIFVKAQDFQINADTVTINADTAGAVVAPDVYLGKVNTSILTAQPDGEQYTDVEALYDDLSRYDEVMTKQKFVKWWNTYMVPFLSEYALLKTKFSEHTHNGFAPPLTQAETITTDKESKAKNLSTVLASKTVKAL